MVLLTRLFATIGLLVALVVPALAEKRVALVIGNGAYTHAKVLPNPKNDAADVGQMLDELKFDVTMLVDLDGDEFAETLSVFRKKVSGADIAIFYYAGHGFQFDGENYLMPIDARLANEFSVQAETIGLRQILGLMEGAGISLVFLDACRDNSLATELKRSLEQLGRTTAMQEGLAPVRFTGRDTLVAYAAAPDQVALDGAGRNSPFTTAVLQHLPTPGIEISTALKRVTLSVREATAGKQLPEQLTAMATEFYMQPDTERPVVSDEETAFLVASRSDTVVAWGDFIQRYPNSPFLGQAREALSRLSAGAVTQPDDDQPPAEGTGGFIGWKGPYADQPALPAAGTQAYSDLVTEKLRLHDAAENRHDHSAMMGLEEELTALNNAFGAERLVRRLSLGEGVPKDLPRVVSIKEDQIARGFYASYWHLGFLYDKGDDGLARDAQRAASNLIAGYRDPFFDLTIFWWDVAEDTRKEIQTQLRDAGAYDTSEGTVEIDGQMGPRTRAALKRMRAIFGVEPGIPGI